MTARRPTIVDVARRAGVSQSAVSFALNGRAGVSEDTRQRILSVADELGWQPSHRARALSVSRAFCLGLVIARAPELLGSDPFYPSFIAGVETVLSGRGQSLVLQVVADAAAEIEGYRRLARDGRVDGVFLADLRHGDTRLAVLEELGMPAITLNRPDVATPFPAVILDDHPGITEAVAHLVDLGHTNIAHVAGPETFLHGTGRLRAFTDAVDAAGLRPGGVAVADFTAAGGTNATRQLLLGDRPPTAIVYSNDLMAIAGMATAHELGFSVPDRLSVTGYDDTELAAHVRPALTTVRANPFAWGQTAANTLLALIEDGRDSVRDVELAPGRLVVRSSTAPPRQIGLHLTGG